MSAPRPRTSPTRPRLGVGALVLGLALTLLAPLPAHADPLGPPVFGTPTYTAFAGQPGTTAEDRPCPAGSVLIAIPVTQNPGRYVTAAGARCAPVRVTSGQAGLGASAIAGWLPAAPVGTTASAESTCRAGWVVVGFRYTDAQGQGVDSLGAECAELRPDGTLDDHDGDEIQGDGQQVGVDTNEVRSRAYCPEGSVATGVSGVVAYDDVPEALTRFRLRCQPLGFPSTAPGDTNVTWATALTIEPNSTTRGDLDKPGQDRWFRFPVQPGSRVTVTLSDLPADYDLTLFRDIGQAFVDVTTREELTKLSAEFAGDAFAPSVFSPSVFSPSVFSPSVFSPSVFSPSVFSPSVFSPSVFSPSVFSPSVFSPSVFSPSVFSPSVFSPSVSQAETVDASLAPSVFSPSVFSDAYSSAQTRSVIGVSKRDGRATEDVSTATWNNTGYYYVRVQGRNGSFVPDAPFTLTVATQAGICQSGLDTFSGTPTLNGVPGSAQTVILTDPARMPGTAAEKSALATAVTAFAGRVGGRVVDVGQSQRVQALQTQANSARFVSCPYAKNLVAEAIRDIVSSYRNSTGTLQYVVVVGDDSVIPFFRYPDQAGLGPENSYAPPMADDTASEASLRGNYVLGQDAYGSTTDVTLKGTEVPVPDLAVGRLVESPADVTATLNRFVNRNGAPITPASSLATGYDFLTDNADAVAADFRAGIPGGTNDTLITDADVPPTTVTQGTPSRRASWTATDLRNSLFGRRHDLVFLAGHFSANNTLAADYTTTVNASEVTAATFADTLVFSGGCHSGYTVVDREGIPQVTVGLDWTEAFTKAGATLVAGTGYQYGDTDFLEYSERIYADFARQLRYGSGAVPIGQALQRAKLTYLTTTPTLQGIDQKSLIQATLYGLPMLGVNLPGGRLPAPTESSTASPGPVTGAPAHRAACSGCAATTSP